jgi:hypothetical protein
MVVILNQFYQVITDPHASIKIFAPIIENHVCSATGASQITTVVNGKYNPIYSIGPVVNASFQTITGN